MFWINDEDLKESSTHQDEDYDDCVVLATPPKKLKPELSDVDALANSSEISETWVNSQWHMYIYIYVCI